REIAETLLRPEDMARFIREAAERAPIFALTIQGYEPLLPEALPYTQAILATGRFLGLPTGMVTNGTKLAGAVDLLKTLVPNTIAVSLDAASADIHDRIRGGAGAWAASLHGIKRAIEVLAPQTRLVVNSVLQPSKRRYLDDMPARLREIGIDQWNLIPLKRVGSDRTGAGGPVADRASLYSELLILQEAADRVGVRLTVDDEFDHLNHDVVCVSQPSLRRVHVRTASPHVEI